MKREKPIFDIDEYTRKVFDLSFEETGVDLRSCVKGDSLVCKDGTTIYYVQPLPDSIYDHEISYDLAGKRRGTRTNLGKVLKSSNTESDIVQIIRKYV